MKKLVCEMCGGKLMKEDGVFVCQNCGANYSVEEAKKMMVDVSGSTVNVANQAQFENLCKLAKTALESNNCAEAEKQANLALAINASDYEILLIKARAIDGQTNGEKSRLLEVFNCYISAYEILSDEDKEQKKNELFYEIVNSFINEITFWVGLVEKNRPSKGTVSDAIDALSDALKGVEIAGEKMNIEIADTKNLVVNRFIGSVSAMSNSAWNTTVAYNYYRDSLYDYGRHWKTRGQDVTDEFRPMDETFDSFSDEVDDLISIMRFAVEHKNEKTDYGVLAALYSNMAFYLEKKRDAVSFSRFYHQDSYGGYYEYWQLNHYWTDATKFNFDSMIKEWRTMEKKYDKLEEERKAKEEAERKAKEEAEAKARFDAYWEEHKEDKAALESEKKELSEKIKAFNDEIEKVPGKESIDEQNKVVEKLISDKKALGLFKLKEKKAVQEKIDEETLKLNNLKKKRMDEINAIKAKIEPLSKRISEINDELTKAR